MSAVRTSLTATDLPDDLGGLRRAIENAIPVGFAQRSDPINHPLSSSGTWSRWWHIKQVVCVKG